MDKTIESIKPDKELHLRRSPRLAALQARRARSASVGGSPPGNLTESFVVVDHVDCPSNMLQESREIKDSTFAMPTSSGKSLRVLRKRKQKPDESYRDNSPKRQRKTEDDDFDNISIRSLNFGKKGRRRYNSQDNTDGDGDNISIQSYTAGTSSRRSRTLVKVPSLASLVSPVTSVRKVSRALHRSMSFRTSHSPPANIKPYCKPVAKPTMRKDNSCWFETFQGKIHECLTKRQIKRQEVIYELFCGELDMVNDLRLIMKTYRDSMRSLGMLSEAELETIFNRLEDLQPLHEDLISCMNRQRSADGVTDQVGKVLLEWLPTLTNVYTAYCANLLAAKVLLDEKRQDKKVQDFLERCQESPFSRRLDLWNFLDVPRRRLIKYPLLIQNIFELTPNDHPDKTDVAKAIKASQRVSQTVDRLTGEMKCRHYIDQLVYLRNSQEHHLIGQQTTLMCGGVLRNTKGRGMKLHVFLFEDVLVVTRIATHHDKKMYQVYENPIPVRHMHLENLADGEVKLSGSFRNLTGSQTVKHAFKIKSTDPDLRQSYTFFASDEHDKKQWIQVFSSAISSASRASSLS